MAQDFRQHKERNIGTSAVDFPNGSDFNSFDCIVGIRLANTHTQSVTVEAYIQNGGNNFYLIKNAPIPSGSSLELISFCSKLFVQLMKKLITINKKNNLKIFIRNILYYIRYN